MTSITAIRGAMMWIPLLAVALFPILSNMYLSYTGLAHTNTAAALEREIYALKNSMIDEGGFALEKTGGDEGISVSHLVLADTESVAFSFLPSQNRRDS